MKQIVGVIALVMLLGNTALAKTPDLDPKRTGLIKGVISRGALVLSEGLTKFGMESNDPVSLVIDSPGGSVIAGNYIINAIDGLKGKGIQVNCYVTGMAVSMAFQILLHCSNRYAMPYSQFLWHSARTGYRGAITIDVALSLAKSLDYVDRILAKDLILTMGGDTQAILEHYKLESFHLAEQVNELAPGFLKVESSLGNAPDLLLTEGVLTSETQGFFMILLNAQDLLYMGRSIGGGK